MIFIDDEMKTDKNLKSVILGKLYNIFDKAKISRLKCMTGSGICTGCLNSSVIKHTPLFALLSRT